MLLHRHDGGGLDRGVRFAVRLVLFAVILISLNAPPSQAQSLPATVNISFRTTMTAVRSHNPRMLGAVTVFPIKVNLYDSLPAEYVFSAFTLNPFKVVVPAAASPISVSATIEYQTGTTGRTELCRFSVTLASAPQTVPCTSSTGFAAFATALQHDVTAGATATRILEKVLFIVTLRSSGPADSPLSLDFDIVFTAVAKTVFGLG